VVAHFLGGTLTCFCRPCWGLVGSTLLGPEGTSTRVWGGCLLRKVVVGRRPTERLAAGPPGFVWGVVVGAAVSGEGDLSVL